MNEQTPVGVCEVCRRYGPTTECECRPSLIAVPFVGTGWICRNCDRAIKRTRYETNEKVNRRLQTYEKGWNKIGTETKRTKCGN